MSEDQGGAVVTAVAGTSGRGCPVSDFARRFDPLSDDYLQDPYSVFDEARRAEPVFYSPTLDYWVVSGYEDIREIFRDTESYSAAAAAELLKPPCPAAGAKLAEVGFVPRPYLVDEDPPVHTQRRQVLRKGVSGRRVAELEPAVREFVNRYLDRIVKNGRADLVSDLVFEVPALTAFALMGVPEADVARVKTYASRFSIWMWGLPSDPEQTELASDFAEYYAYAKEHVQRLLAEPGDNDYVSNAISGWRAPGNAELFDEEYLYITFLGHFLASHETTTNGAANGFKALLEHRAQWQELVADPSLIPNAVEEVLRHSSSVPAWRRTTVRPVRIGQVDIPAGARVLILTGSANHDEAVFLQPERLDVRRANAREHLAFGWGRHLCLGAHLARMEMRVILEETIRRLPHLELVEGQEWTYSRNISFRGPEHVLVRWDPALNPIPDDRP